MTYTPASTEAVDASTASIDRIDSPARVRALIETHRRAVDAALDAAPAIADAVERIASALRAGGRVRYVGAGTSGRLGVLDASELPPTFGLEPGRINALIAGGDGALRHAIEGAEDDAAAGAAAVADLAAGDVVVGISASGGAPYVCEALDAAHARGITTIAVVNAVDARLTHGADVAIVVATGAEAIAGSTRLRAGTAQKIVLNTLSTAAMIELGKTYRNRMVDVSATNVKLRARAERLVRDLAGDVDAAALLAATGGRVKAAVVMARRNVGCEAADALLEAANGRLADVIDDA